MSSCPEKNVTPVAKELIILVVLVICELIYTSLCHPGTSDVTDKNRVRHGRHQLHLAAIDVDEIQRDKSGDG